mgnify:CR=1 FL=1
MVLLLSSPIIIIVIIENAENRKKRLPQTKLHKHTDTPHTQSNNSRKPLRQRKKITHKDDESIEMLITRTIAIVMDEFFGRCFFGFEQTTHAKSILKFDWTIFKKKNLF